MPAQTGVTALHGVTVQKGVTAQGGMGDGGGDHVMSEAAPVGDAAPTIAAEEEPVQEEELTKEEKRALREQEKKVSRERGHAASCLVRAHALCCTQAREEGDKLRSANNAAIQKDMDDLIKKRLGKWRAGWACASAA